MNNKDIRASAAEYLTYIAATGNSQDNIEMRYEDENIWLTQKMMVLLDERAFRRKVSELIGGYTRSKDVGKLRIIVKK